MQPKNKVISLLLTSLRMTFCVKNVANLGEIKPHCRKIQANALNYN